MLLLRWRLQRLRVQQLVSRSSHPPQNIFSISNITISHGLIIRELPCDIVILLSYLPRKKWKNGKCFVAMLSMGRPDNALLVFRWHFRLVPIIPWGGKVPFLSLEGAIGTTVIPYRNEPYFGLLTAERFLFVSLAAYIYSGK